MGIILTGEEDVNLRELTEVRSAAALPVAGRYRLIDFVLSGMVNSGIINVGVATRHKYSSLMGHLGAGSPWDLQREHYGLFLLPPFANHEPMSGMAGDLDVLYGTMHFLQRSRQKYVVLAEATTVLNITFRKALSFHKESGADITVIYKENPTDTGESLVLETEADGHICDLAFCRPRRETKKVGIGMYIMEKELLVRILEDAVARGEHDFKMDVLIRNPKELSLYGWHFSGYAEKIDSIASYFSVNMDVLREEVQTALFRQEDLIFTKVKNRVPTRYGDNARVSGCLVADGCSIEGSAENCVLFRGVKIGTEAKLKNCIVMEKTHVDSGCCAENVIFDKECLMREGRHLAGQPNYPVIIRKGAVI